MAIAPSSLEFELPKHSQRPGGRSTSVLGDLPGMQSASAGVPEGTLVIPSLRHGGCHLAGSSDAYRVNNDAYQVVRLLYIGATAQCYLLDFGNVSVDARAIVAREWAPTEELHRSNAALRISRLVTIKAAFGFSNSDLARICRVSRPQLYKWLSDEQTLELTAPNWGRIGKLETLAKYWNSVSPRPLERFADVRIGQKMTIIDFLSAAKLDDSAVRDAMNRLASATAELPLSREAKMRQAGLTPSDLPGNLPWDE